MSTPGGTDSGELTQARHIDKGELYCPHCDSSFRGEIVQCPSDGTKLVRLHEATDPLIGRNIDGRFVIRARIGSGGMGAVYLALQGSVGREVALKVIEARLSSGKVAAKRFLREAKLSARLQQPNTVTVLDFGQTDDGLLYLVMELVKGRTLNTVLEAEGPFSVERMARVGIQLCDALEAAHRLAIIHRDLKPSNIILLDEPAGRDAIKVLDFGLAKSLAGEQESTTMTQSDAIMGTPSYIPPEAVLTMQFDARSDLYSMGVILYELLTGYLPFTGTTVQTMLRAHAYEPPHPLPALVPVPVQNLLYRMLEKEPDRRYQSAIDVRAELQAVVADRAAGAAGLAATAVGAPSRGGGHLRPMGRSSSRQGDTTSMTPLPYPRRKRSSRWTWVIGAAALATVGVASMMAASLGDEGEATEAGQPNAIDRPSPPAPVMTGAPATEGLPLATAPAVEAVGTTIPATVTLRLAAKPKAIVWVDGVRLGPSPQEFTTPRSDQALQVRFEQEGYEPLVVKVVPERNSDIERSLDRVVPRRGGKRGPGQIRAPINTGPERPNVKWVPSGKKN